jgi:hypothetical protein
LRRVVRTADGDGAGFLPLTLGAAALVLALWMATALGERLLGPPWSALAVALDPTRGGSLPELCGLVQLGLATAALLLADRTPGGAGLRRLALLPGILLLVDVTDLVSALAPPGRHALPLPVLKLAVVAVVGGVVLLPVCGLWRDPAPERRALVASLLRLLLLAGPPLLALDAAAGADRWLGLAGEGKHALVALEETGELLLYAALAGILLDGIVAMLRQESHDMGLYVKPDTAALPASAQR